MTSNTSKRREILAFVGAALFAFTLNAFFVWLVADYIPAYGTEQALWFFLFGVMVFRVLHKTPYRARIRDDTTLWKADLLFHFVPFGVMLLIVKIAPGLFVDRLRHLPWVIDFSASMLIHRQWNLVVTESRTKNRSSGQTSAPPEVAWEEDQLQWQSRHNPLTNRESLSIIGLGVLTFVYYLAIQSAHSFIDNNLILNAQTFRGEIWRLLTSLFVCRDVIILMSIIVTATFAGLVVQRLRASRFLLVLVVPGLIANLLVAPFLNYAPSQALDASLLPSFSMCVAFGFLYSRISLKTISRFTVNAEILVMSLGGADLLLDVTRGGWVAFVRDTIAILLAFGMTIHFGVKSYTKWRITRLVCFLGSFFGTTPNWSTNNIRPKAKNEGEEEGESVCPFCKICKRRLSFDELEIDRITEQVYCTSCGCEIAVTLPTEVRAILRKR